VTERRGVLSLMRPKGPDLSKGWIAVPGIREQADRTLSEQMAGLEHALSLTSGKTVLDLGCAEGLIGREFALAGAVSVLGIEVLETHLEVARKACADCKQMRFICANLEDYMQRHEPPAQFDIVLCLGIAHKLRNPESVMRFSCRSARDLVCFRAPASAWDGWFRAKHGGERCHVPTIMAKQGFTLERHVAGKRGEGVEYWRRKR